MISFSLFNGISTFVGFLVPKKKKERKSSDIIKSLGRGIRVFIPFSRVFIQKSTYIARLEFELTYSKVSVERLSYYATVCY